MPGFSWPQNHTKLNSEESPLNIHDYGKLGYDFKDGIDSIDPELLLRLEKFR